MIEAPCKALSSESGKALKALATAMKMMADPSSSSHRHLNAAKSAINDLKDALKSATALISNDPSSSNDLLAIIPDATVACKLIEIVKSVENLSESVGELSVKAHFKKVEATVSPEKPQLLHRGTIKPVAEVEEELPHVVITVEDCSPEKEGSSGTKSLPT